jgi:parallel beta-helix repeat protein
MVAPGTDDNLIEDNTVLGNSNGIYLAAGVAGNVIRRNFVAGNPPVQVSVAVPATSGWDIRNLAAPAANTFADNFCLTSINAACPALDDMHRLVR